MSAPPALDPALALADARQATLRAIRMFLDRLPERFDVVQAILFGSRARGTHHEESDTDLALILRGEKTRTLPLQLEMSDIAFDVLLETGVNLSPLAVWESDWEHPERHSNPDLLAAIAEEGIPV